MHCRDGKVPGAHPPGLADAAQEEETGRSSPGKARNSGREVAAAAGVCVGHLPRLWEAILKDFLGQKNGPNIAQKTDLKCHLERFDG